MADEPEEDETVPVEVFLDMSARLAGRIQALEAVIAILLSDRQDTARLAPRVDTFLLNDEASRIAVIDIPEAAMQTHEWARQAAEALFKNAALAARHIKK